MSKHAIDRSAQVVHQTVRLQRFRSGWDKGVALIYDPQGLFYEQFDSGQAKRLVTARWAPGLEFTVRLLTHFGDDFYDDWFTFAVTGDPNDSDVFWTGPGDWARSDKPSVTGQMFYGVSVEGATLHRYEEAVPQRPVYGGRPVRWVPPPLTLG